MVQEAYERQHDGMMINVQEGHLVVLFLQNHEDCVQKLHRFGNVVKP